jgi:hypothetical protein
MIGEQLGDRVPGSRSGSVPVQCSDVQGNDNDRGSDHDSVDDHAI